jgi:hypothetical protein
MQMTLNPCFQFGVLFRTQLLLCTENTAMQKQQQDVFRSWAKFLNPASLKSNLTNPDFDDQDVHSIDDAEITSGNMMFLQMMIEIATGDDAIAGEMYNQLMQMAEQRAAKTSV